MFRIEKRFIAVEHGSLEAQLYIPDIDSKVCLVLTHPHPLYGGTMHNRIVALAADTAVRYGFHVFCFNFRGAGYSTGFFSGGIGEIQDFHEVLQTLRQEYPTMKYLVGGYSFGAWVTHQWLERQSNHILAYLGIAPPTSVYPFDAPMSGVMHWYCYGTRDPFVNTGLLTRWAREKAGLVSLEPIVGADHEFRDHEEELVRHLAGFLARYTTGEVTPDDHEGNGAHPLLEPGTNHE